MKCNHHSLLPCCTFSHYMVPNSVLLFSTTPPIVSSSANLIHDSIPSNAAGFNPFQQIFVDTSGKTINVSTREAPYRTSLLLVTLTRIFSTLRQLLSMIASQLNCGTVFADLCIRRCDFRDWIVCRTVK